MLIMDVSRELSILYFATFFPIVTIIIGFFSPCGGGIVCQIWRKNSKYLDLLKIWRYKISYKI